MQGIILPCLLLAVGLYIAAVSENLIKKLIGLNVFVDGIHLLVVSIGYAKNSIPPIFFKSVGSLSTFVAKAVDPLPQAMILTSIVIDTATTALALILIYALKEKRGV